MTGSNQPAVGLLTNRDHRVREIVQKAARLFDKRGYDRVSMEDISQAVGLAKPSLYHYVRGKDEILTLIHSEFMDLVLRKIEERDSSSLGAREQLVAAMADILGLMATHRGHVRVFFEHHRELAPKARRAIARQRDLYEGRVRAIIEQGIASGELRQVDARMVTLAVFGMCNWAYQWYDRSGELSPEQIAQQFGGYLLDGVAAVR